MSNTSLIIEERSRDIGNFKVGRLLPFRKKRMVGPFIFIDHMGPAVIKPGNYMDVDQHPHIGLSTLTYLIEGEIVHQDSTGANQLIKPGTVNWMTGGKGVVHTERTPEHLRDGAEHTIHGYQIWVALPKKDEFVEPSFHHFDANELPHWEEKNTTFRLIAGEAYQRKSPVPVYSKLFMIELSSIDFTDIDTKDNLYGEIGICVVQGSVQSNGETIKAGNMMVSKAEDTCCFSMSENSKVFLFGGESFPEQRNIFWNFVASDKETIEQAKVNWKNKNFNMVENDSTYINLPQQKSN